MRRERSRLARMPGTLPEIHDRAWQVWGRMLAAPLPGDTTMPFDAPPATDLAVVELRQYTLKPGARDELLALFDKFFVDGQAASGIRVLGAYRDAKDANRFVWFRGFRDMASRRASLAGFYGGPVWKAHRTAANATMIDSDDVLLLRPLDRGVAVLPRDRWLLATVWLL